jgi:hypothetical protein
MPTDFCGAAPDATASRAKYTRPQLSKGHVPVNLEAQAPPKVLLVGVGDVTIRLLHLLAAHETAFDVTIASRSLERATRFANLARLAASNLGAFRSVAAFEFDLRDISRTAECLATLHPDIVFVGASIQPARAIVDLPPELFRQLDQAQLGPWLPMHLTLNYELMQAVRMLESKPWVVNAAYPDAVGPALKTVGLAPDVGIGNVANIIPGLTFAVSEQSGIPPQSLELKLIAQHYFSHHVHRYGEADGIPHRLHVTASETTVSVDSSDLFQRLALSLRREGGREGQQITATSAAKIIFALTADKPRLAHAPAPHGLVGGLPVSLSRHAIELDLPDDITVGDAIETNQQCQRLDGIETIAADGSVYFGAEQMAVMEQMLGYACRRLRVEESRLAAEELAQRYAAFLRAHRLVYQ